MESSVLNAKWYSSHIYISKYEIFPVDFINEKRVVTASRDKVRVKRVWASNKVIFMTRGGTKKSQSWVFRVSWVFRFHSISVFQFHSWAGVEWRGKVSHRTPISQRLHLSLSKSHWLLTPSCSRQRTSYSSDTHDDNTEIVSNHDCSVQEGPLPPKSYFCEEVDHIFIHQLHLGGPRNMETFFPGTIGFKILSLFSFIQIFYLWEERKIVFSSIWICMFWESRCVGCRSWVITVEEHRGELGTFWCEDGEIIKLEKGFFGILCDAVDRIKVGSACIAGYWW